MAAKWVPYLATPLNYSKEQCSINPCMRVYSIKIENSNEVWQSFSGGGDARVVGYTTLHYVTLHWISQCVRTVAPIPRKLNKKKENLSPVTCHQSPVTCHMAPVTRPPIFAASLAMKVPGGLVMQENWGYKKVLFAMSVTWEPFLPLVISKRRGMDTSCQKSSSLNFPKKYWRGFFLIIKTPSLPQPSILIFHGHNYNLLERLVFRLFFVTYKIVNVPNLFSKVARFQNIFFFFSLALLFPMKVKIFVYNGDFNWKLSTKRIILKKNLSMILFQI